MRRAPDMQRLCVRIHGRVQGVAFRFYTRRRALGLGLSGWVQNRADGSVELCAEGPRDALEALLVWCGQGPDFALVESLEHEYSAAEGQFEDFSVRA